MKKFVLGLLMCSSLITPALAAEKNISEEDKIKNIIAYNIQSDDVEYKDKIQLKKVGQTYSMTIPAGVLKADKQVNVPSFSFLLNETGKLNGQKRYQVTLNKFSQIFPSLNVTFKKHNATYAAAHYIGNFVPALDLVESQQVQINNLLVPVDKNTQLSIGFIQFDDKSTPEKNDAIKQNTALSLKNLNLKHTLFNVAVKDFNLDINVPTAYMGKNPLDQVLKTPQMTQKMVISDVKISSPLMPDESFSFDFTQSLDVKQNQTQGNVPEVFAKVFSKISNIQAKGTEYIPSEIDVALNAKGFTFTQLLTYSAATQRLTDIKSLPNSPRKENLLKDIEKEAKKAHASLVEKMVVDVDKIAVNSDKYTAVLKGKFIPKKEEFKGTLTVSNFAYLAPAPQKTDEAACKAVMDKMLAGSLTENAFKAEFNKTCNEKRGPLDILRPYAASAHQVRNEKGENALMFDVEIHDDDLFINGKKVENAPFMD